MKRFWDKVEKTNGCWNWIGKIRSKNSPYGAFKFQGKVVQSHRFSWFLTKSIWPKLNVLHKCDNPLCVNLEHLYEGTPKDNARDMHERGRAHIFLGEEAPAGKLKTKQVLEIRNKYIPNIVGYKKLAMEYGVDYHSIKAIVKRTSWKHI